MENEKKSIAKASEEYMRLLAYVVEQPHGAMLSYDEVCHHTGVKMDIPGKAKLRRTILRSKKEYSVVPNVGYKLADADIATGILSFRLIRIDNTVKRADRAQRIIQREFLNDLTEDEKKGVLFIGSVFGAIRIAADKGKKLYSGQPVKMITQEASKPIMPE